MPRNSALVKAHVAFALCTLAISRKQASCFVSVVRQDRPNAGAAIGRAPTTHTRVLPAGGLFLSDPRQEQENGPLSRFTDPIIDDPGLPLADTLVSQVVAPSLQVFWLSLLHAPSPTWLKPIFDNTLWQARGSLVAPTLIHGAGLAFCWLAGALAAQAYERKAIDPTVDGYATLLFRIAQAGAFATGLLIMGTQVDLFVEYGRYVQPGESEEIDLRLLSAMVELINDVVFEAFCITSMRLFLAFMTERGARNRNN